MKNIEEVKVQLLKNDLNDLFKGFDINSFDNHGNNILHYYIKNMESIAIESDRFLNLCLNEGINLNALMTKSPKCSALNLAVKLKKRNLVESLLKYNVEIDSVDENGNTPLCQAVMGYRNDEPFYIKSLLAKGADKNIENLHGVSPLSLANTIANYDSKSLLN